MGKIQQADHYHVKALKAVLDEILSSHLDSATFSLLQQTAEYTADRPQWLRLFSNMQRVTGKTKVSIPEGQRSGLLHLAKGFSIDNWDMDRLARVYLLLHVNSGTASSYHSSIEKLFTGAVVSEQVALYSALPLYAYPESWQSRCAEGIRSNIADVLEAIMYENPYPLQHLPEAAWNQMLLKAIFTEKELHRIQGLHQRNNPELSRAIIDYTAERWAAGRTIDPYIWSLVNHIENREGYALLEKGLQSPAFHLKQAAALALFASRATNTFSGSEQQLLQLIGSHELNWKNYHKKNFITP